MDPLCASREDTHNHVEQIPIPMRFSAKKKKKKKKEGTTTKNICLHSKPKALLNRKISFFLPTHLFSILSFTTHFAVYPEWASPTSSLTLAFRVCHLAYVLMFTYRRDWMVTDSASPSVANNYLATRSYVIG